jgi:hypothetical protein
VLKEPREATLPLPFSLGNKIKLCVMNTFSGYEQTDAGIILSISDNMWPTTSFWEATEMNVLIHSEKSYCTCG